VRREGQGVGPFAAPRGQSGAGRASRRARVAWLVSVLAHALLAGSLAYLSPGRRSNPDKVRSLEPVQIEISEAPPPIAAPSEVRPEAPSAPAPRGGGHARRVEAQPAGGGIGPVREAEPGRTDSVDAPTMPEGAPRSAGADTGPLDLSFGALSLVAQKRLSGSESDVELRAVPHHRRSVDELRVEVERQEDAVANVEAGRADPILYDYLRGARQRFEADARRLAESIPLGAGEAVKSWQRGYLQRVDGINRGAAADRDGPPGEGIDAVRRSSGEPPPTDLFAAYGEATRGASDGAEERKAEVCLDMAPGKTPVPSLRRQSGNAALDRLVVESFVRAIAARPVPPDVRTGLACYEVRLSAFRMPPVPIASCGFDGSGFSCVWPFKKISSVTAKLLSVDYVRGSSTAANRSLLRRPR
jgi:hypothetical protein